MGVAEEETGDRRGDESGRKESITAWHAAACQPFDLTKPRSDHRNYLNPRAHSLLTGSVPYEREGESVACVRANFISLCSAAEYYPSSFDHVERWCATRIVSDASTGGGVPHDD